jgi:hypothetical protein
VQRENPHQWIEIFVTLIILLAGEGPIVSN